VALSDLPQAIFDDLRAFVDGGAGAWRIKQIRVPSLSALPAVRRLVDSHQCSEADAVERAIEAAARSIESPHREAALAHLGFTERTRHLSRTKREEAAADELHVAHRTYLRTETPRDARSRSYADQVLWLVADALLTDAAPNGGKRILYVEDDPVFVDIVRQALPDYEVEDARDLGTAMSTLEARASDFCLVLVDANLTNLDDRAGYEVLQYMLDKCPGIPRILITASRLTGPVRKDFLRRFELSELLIKDHQMVPGLRASVADALGGAP
jgi:CheY-like chemotaxis protein